jgi:ubiquinone/menaquinone biosynthesis C-methylase UbiE
MKYLDHFEILAPLYEELFPVREVGRWMEFLRLPCDGTLLDAGGGTGRVSEVLKSHVGRIVVADASPGMAKQAARKTDISAVCTQTEALPYPDGAFDRVIMVDALHHVTDQRITAGELWRVLKPGGILLIEEPDVRKFSVKLLAVAEKLMLMRSHFLSPPAIENLFRYPQAAVKVYAEGYTAWIVVERIGDD